MWRAVRAVVLSAVAHGESTYILRCCTEDHGLRAYAWRPQGKGQRTAVFAQPLQRLSMVVHEPVHDRLGRARDLRSEKPYVRVPFEPPRGAVLLFVQEVLLRALREGADDTSLFHWLHQALDLLDRTEDLPHYPLTLLITLGRELGIMPDPSAHAQQWFDMVEGCFTDHLPSHAQAIPQPMVTAFTQWLKADLHREAPMRLPYAQRRELLDHVLRYFRIHIEGFGELRSPDMLHQALA
jgi:DNA repair protein RecO (recombination protein O)